MRRRVLPYLAILASAPAALSGQETARAGAAPPAATAAEAVALPSGDVFRPLIADPKQPQFIASALRTDSRLRDTWVGSTGFGENIGLVLWPGRRPGEGLQIGLAGGVFAQFDLEAESMDLLNADYVIGVPVTYRRGSVSGRARLYHQSSHLGDEFLLAEQPERVNLSFEALELLVAKEIGGWRTYLGGEWLFRREPSDLDDAVFHVGLEYRHRPTWVRLGGFGSGRWIAALDAKSWNSADPAWSLRTGLEFAPYGQFYNEEISAVGVGLFFSL
ncbi:MAG: DUF1207 domain-containing protein [Gemmatimonadota bacterium]